MLQYLPLLLRTAIQGNLKEVNQGYILTCYSPEMIVADRGFAVDKMVIFA